MLFSLKTEASYIVPLNPVGPDDSYFLSGQIEMGTPPQVIQNVGLDTGSTPLWVGGKGCSKCPGTLFDGSQSSTFSKTTDSFKIKYDDGSKFSGVVAKDNVKLGNVTVQGMEFGLISSAKFKQDQALYSQALMGLAPVCCGDTPASIIDAWKAEGINSFNMYLPPNLTSMGSMCIDCPLDSSLYKGEFVKVPVTLSDEAWNAPPVKLLLADGTEVSSKMYPGIFDTGSDLIYTPKSVFKEWCSKIGWKVSGSDCLGDCNKVSQLPDFVLDFGNVKLKLRTQNYLTYKYEGSKCALSAISSNDKYGWTFGVAVIRQFYSVWNWGQTPSISFAESV